MAPTPDDPTGALATGESARARDAPGERVTVVLPQQRDRATAPADSRRRAPLVVAGVVNALWAATLSFLPMLGTVAAVTLIGPDRPALGPTLRFGAAGWLLAHGVPLAVEGQAIALAPLAVTILAAWRALRAGRNTVRAIGARRATSVRPALAAAVTVAIAYGLIGAGVAAVARGSGLGVSPIRSGLTLGVFALVMAFLGGWSESLVARRLRARMPRALRDGVRTGVVAVLALFAAGSVAVGVSIAVSGSTATVILHNMRLGFAAEAGIVLVCLAYAPNFAVWAAAYLVGPGFTLARVPELPVFAALPTRPVTGVGEVLLAIPVLAGAAAGVLLARRRARREAAARATAPGDGEPRPVAPVARLPLLGAAALAGPVAALVLGAVGFLAAGALGSGALANTGQVGWEFAVIGGIGVGLGAMVGALVAA